VENIILTEPDYSKWCLLNYAASPAAWDDPPPDPPCAPPASPLTLFYGVPDPRLGFQEQSLTPEDIQAALRSAVDNLAAYSTFFDQGFGPSRLQSKWTRAFLRFGFPNIWLLFSTFQVRHVLAHAMPRSALQLAATACLDPHALAALSSPVCCAMSRTDSLRLRAASRSRSEQ
jgi:hypothetical protein